MDRYEDYRRRWLEFWNRENHDRPLVSVTAPLGKGRPDRPAPPEGEARWCDPVYAVQCGIDRIEDTYYAGEAFPLYCPNLGPDLVGAVSGCGIAFGDETSWAVHTVEDWETLPPIRFDERNIWWQRILAITEEAVRRAQGRFLVGITDLHPGTDGLVSLRGPELLCMDIMDCPETILRRNQEVFQVYKEIYTRLNRCISAAQKGSTNWMGIWHPQADWYVVGSDFSCLLSQEDYDSFVLPGVRQELDFLQASMYHLDGPGALRHLDRILSLEKLGGVQWVYGAGQPSARHWLEVLTRIQAAGKNIQVDCQPDDLPALCEVLAPEGVHLVCYAASPLEADRVLKMAETLWCDKRPRQVAVK